MGMGAARRSLWSVVTYPSGRFQERSWSGITHRPCRSSTGFLSCSTMRKWGGMRRVRLARLGWSTKCLRSATMLSSRSFFSTRVRASCQSRLTLGPQVLHSQKYASSILPKIIQGIKDSTGKLPCCPEKFVLIPCQSNHGRLRASSRSHRSSK
jgi:hypothetical protein